MPQQIETYSPHLQRIACQCCQPTGRDYAELGNDLLQRQQKWSALKKGKGDAYPASAVYGLFAKNELIYVGQTTVGKTRLLAHASGGASFGYDKPKTFDGAAFLPVEPAHLNLVERRTIKTFRPVLNAKHARPRKEWGMVYLDDLAEALQVPVGVLFRVCNEAGIIPVTRGDVYPLMAILHAIGERKLIANV